jgi:hypothetical protein
VDGLTEGEKYNARLGDPAVKDMLNVPRWLNAFTNLVVEAYVPTKPESIAACKQALSDLQHSDTTATVPDVQAEFLKIFEFQPIFDETAWKVSTIDIDHAINRHVQRCTVQGVGSALSKLKRPTKTDALRACGARNPNGCKVRGNRAWAGIKLLNPLE